jgi:peroxiredoxin-like protein
MSHEFIQTVSYQGGRDGCGEIAIAGRELVFASPSSLGGCGKGTNPEELLLAAMGACYSLTLSIITAKSQPSIASVAVKMEATVVEETEPKRRLFFREIRLIPQIHLKPSAAAPDPAALQAACAKAESACFITQTVKPGAGAVVLKDYVVHQG